MLPLWLLHCKWACIDWGLTRGWFNRSDQLHCWLLQLLSLWHFIHVTSYWPLVGLSRYTIRKYLVGSGWVATFTVISLEDRVDSIYSCKEGFRALYQLYPALHSLHIHNWQLNTTAQSATVMLTSLQLLIPWFIQPVRESFAPASETILKLLS